MSQNDYGYEGHLSSIRELIKGLPRAYLDNAASPLVLSTIPYRAADLLVNGPLPVNPHSGGPLGAQTSNIIDGVRSEILRLLNVSSITHELVFCSNATAGAKLVGEALHTHHFAYCVDSHTSIVGLRSLAKTWDTFTGINGPPMRPNSVVSWPLQSNFDGKRYPGKEWTQRVHATGGLVLLDVASFAATEMPDLEHIDADFTILSFYKIFGLPDLGALIVRKTPDSLDFMRGKRYFGGGTVAALAPSVPWMARPTDDAVATWLEDGTLPFHSVIILKAAILEFERIFGEQFMDHIHRHTTAVTQYCRAKLSEIAGCTVYGEPTNSGPIVAFRLDAIGHNEFAAGAALKDVHVRAGTLCNIGAFTLTSQMTDENIVHNYETLGKKCNDEISFIDGIPAGVVRASFGPYSSFEDVDALLEVIKDMETPRCETSSSTTDALASPNGQEADGRDVPIAVEALYTYPIKSCKGLCVNESILTQSGLQYDRLFCLVDLASKRVLSLKQHRAMIFLKPIIKQDRLVVIYDPAASQNSSQKAKSIEIPIELGCWGVTMEHGELVMNLDGPVVDFFSNALGHSCTLAKSAKTEVVGAPQSPAAGDGKPRSFANSSPLLVVTTASGADLDLEDLEVFRPNIVLKTSIPWEEDGWPQLRIKQSESQEVTEISMLGKCRRCNMICITTSGIEESFPYMQLCKYRKDNGKIYFGQHASLTSFSSDAIIRVGDILAAD